MEKFAENLILGKRVLHPPPPSFFKDYVQSKAATKCKIHLPSQNDVNIPIFILSRKNWREIEKHFPKEFVNKHDKHGSLWKNKIHLFVETIFEKCYPDTFEADVVFHYTHKIFNGLN